MPAGKLRLVKVVSSKPKAKARSKVDKRQDKDLTKLRSQVRKLLKADEKKWYDTNRPSTAISTTGLVQPLLGLTVWSGDNTLRQNEREGNTINMLSYRINGEVYIDQNFASPDANNKVRIMLVQMTDDNINAPALTDLLEDTTSTNALYSFYKIKGQRRFKIHYDKTFNLQNVQQQHVNQPYYSSTVTENFRKTFNISAKVPKSGLKISYSQGSISGNGPVVNGLFFVAYSDSGTISHPAIVYRSRMRYLDN